MTYKTRQPSGANPTLKKQYDHQEAAEQILPPELQELVNLALSHQSSPVPCIHALLAEVRTLRGALSSANKQIEALGGQLFETSEKLAREQEAKVAAEIAASMDTLTGLLNRGAFDKQLNTIIQTQKANTSANDNTKNICIVYLDIDGLKQTNDCYGHSAGDRLLRLVTDLLTHSLRPDDQIFRVGGDEMVILMEGDPAKIEQKILKIQAELETKHIRADVCAEWKDIPVWGFSFGVHKVEPNLSVEENYELADVEMYHNKEDRKVAQAAIRQSRLAEMQTDKQKIKAFENWLKSNTPTANDLKLPSIAP